MAWDRTWDRIGWGQDPGEDKQKSKHLALEEAKVARQALGLSLVVTNYWVSTPEPEWAVSPSFSVGQGTVATGWTYAASEESYGVLGN